jgi:hypothetical protein
MEAINLMNNHVNNSRKNPTRGRGRGRGSGSGSEGAGPSW